MTKQEIAEHLKAIVNAVRYSSSDDAINRERSTFLYGALSSLSMRVNEELKSEAQEKEAADEAIPSPFIENYLAAAMSRGVRASDQSGDATG